jgi:lipoyl(octanoyl) transferase
MTTIRTLGLRAYEPVWTAMKRFTTERGINTQDEVWLLEHKPVYTQGQAGKIEHILNAHNIPVVQTDRGGQVTYHGPGQLVAYILMDIKRRTIGIRTLVHQLEQILITLLKAFNISGVTREGAPGVYVGDQKIASIGLRVKNGCTYHGIALNVDMDLSPFSGINPCGYAHLQMTQMSAFASDITMERVTTQWTHDFLALFEH